MELSKINAVVRPRSKWEATDLGFKMASQWFRPLIGGWLVLTLPLFVLLQLVLFDYGPAAVMIMWWLKPLFERIILGDLSHRLFGEASTLKQQLKRWSGVVTRQLLATLLWRRFSPHRSYLLPIVQLENLSGDARQRRMNLFGGANQQAAFWLTMVCIHIESFIAIAIYSLIYFLMPVETGVELSFIAELATQAQLSNLVVYIAMSLVAPYYVTAGFSLYLNQRTRAEGWDIEIVFRQMVERREKKQPKPSVSLSIVAVLLVSLAGFNGHDAMAAEPEQALSAEARQRAEAILALPQFNQMSTQEIPEFVLNWQVGADEADKPELMPGWLAAIVTFIANSLEIILTALVVGLLLLLIYRYRDWFAQMVPNLASAKSDDHSSANIFGLDISEDSLGQNPAAQASVLWQQGQKRQALSLLYRGSLANLVQQQHLTLYDGFTEGECVAQVKRNALPQTAEYFEQLTRSWQRLAYAGIVPQDTVMEALFARFDSAFRLPDVVGSAEAADES